MVFLGQMDAGLLDLIGVTGVIVQGEQAVGIVTFQLIFIGLSHNAVRQGFCENFHIWVYYRCGVLHNYGDYTGICSAALGGGNAADIITNTCVGCIDQQIIIGFLRLDRSDILKPA